jgi:hypothetical protein
MKGLKLAMVAAAGVMLLSAYPLYGIEGRSNRATLKHLKGVAVLVENLPAGVEGQGLSKNQLQSDAELKLRNAGIKVLSREESAKTPGEPYIYINLNLNIAKTENEVYPYSIDLLLIQKVSLLRDPKMTSYAVTWSTGGVGSIGKEIIGQLRDNVREIIDIFITAYKAENPK